MNSDFKLLGRKVNGFLLGNPVCAANAGLVVLPFRDTAAGASQHDEEVHTKDAYCRVVL